MFLFKVTQIGFKTMDLATPLVSIILRFTTTSFLCGFQFFLSQEKTLIFNSSNNTYTVKFTETWGLFRVKLTIVLSLNISFKYYLFSWHLYFFTLHFHSVQKKNTILDSVPFKALWRTIGSSTWKIGSTDFVTMCKKRCLFLINQPIFSKNWNFWLNDPFK